MIFTLNLLQDATTSKQMLPDYVLFAIFVAIIYFVYAYPDSQLASGATPLRTIFSGGCQLDCQPNACARDSEYSGLSDIQGPSQPSGRSCRVSFGEACACVSCPCALLRNLFYPVEHLYEVVTGAATQLHNGVNLVLDEVREYAANFSRVLECAISCQRQAQITRKNSVGSTQNFQFADRNPEVRRTFIDEPLMKVDHGTLPPTKKTSHQLLKKASDIIKKAIRGRKKQPNDDKKVESLADDDVNLDNVEVSGEDLELEKSSNEKYMFVLPKTKTQSNNKKELESSSSDDHEKLLADDDVVLDDVITKESDMLEDLKPTTFSQSHCTTCEQKGKVCLHDCPRAKQ